MTTETRLDTLHAAARRSRLLAVFATVCRLLLALAFLPSGWKKLAGERFTQIGVDQPIGFFFEALYQTGPYYRLIGLAQVVAAVLLLVPRTATLGAWLFLPIVANVVAITVSLHFTGTVFVTVPMLLANLFLVLWDYDRFKPILGSAFGWSAGAPVAPAPEAPARTAAAVLTVGAGAALLLGALLILTEPQRAASPVAASALVLVWALAPVAVWAGALRNVPAARLGLAGGVSAGLLALVLAFVVVWTPVHPAAPLAEVWALPPVALWAVVAVGWLVCRARSEPARALAR
ncbi:MAG TPA: hypothetical protein VGB53_10710 [Rubricoccaceae bacterium]|jgi:uncharacterized membrane protein YphA (DoxX/SURF4 family)